MKPVFATVLGVCALIATVMAHELGHFVGALLSGAQDVQLHWADVTYAEGSVGTAGEAIIWIAGPAVTHTLILSIWLSRSTRLLALAIGLGAASRNLLILPYTLKSLLGRDVSGFFNDEVQVSTAVGISPLILALPTVALGLVGAVSFARRAFVSYGPVVMLALLVSMPAGLVLWSEIGPVVLPGGRGVD